MSTSKDSQALYKIGGAAALAAGILFRRNMAAEIELFGAQPAPEAVSGWFVLLQSNRLLGLAHLHIFDLANYVLLGLVFLGLFAALKHANKSLMQIALVSGVVGIAVYFATGRRMPVAAAQSTDNSQRRLDSLSQSSQSQDQMSHSQVLNLDPGRWSQICVRDLGV